MSIANELSCDVAAAMFTRKEDEAPSSQRELAEVLLVVHSTLRHLTAESRRINSRAGKSSAMMVMPKSGESAASGGR